MFGQVFGDDGRRNAEFVGKIAINIQARRNDRCLDRVKHVETIGQLDRNRASVHPA